VRKQTSGAADRGGRAEVRRRVRRLLEGWHEGFPWVEVIGRPLEGWIVFDSDATAVACASEQEGAAGTYKKGVRLPRS